MLGEDTLLKYVIRRLSNSENIYFEYHTVFRAVKYWAIAESTTGDEQAAKVDITDFLRPLIITTLLRKYGVKA